MPKIARHFLALLTSLFWFVLQQLIYNLNQIYTDVSLFVKYFLIEFRILLKDFTTLLEIIWKMGRKNKARKLSHAVNSYASESIGLRNNQCQGNNLNILNESSHYNLYSEFYFRLSEKKVEKKTKKRAVPLSVLLFKY